MAKDCVICGDNGSNGQELIRAPCHRHWVCTDDVGSFFERATENESLYPPKCCGQILLLATYEAYVDFDVKWAYQLKEQGEYSVLAKYRVYCANPACSKFLNPATHLKDPSNKLTYADCPDGGCGKRTCTTCKTLIDGRTHTCEQNEDYKKFKQTATEKGFQECPTCASTVELAEACNHITCECGTAFCYICGDEWQGMHGCPHYGPAHYDVDGYNQDGYHRTTALDREGLTRRERALQHHGDEEDVEQDDEGHDEDEDDNEDHPALQFVDADIREMFAALPHDEREAFLISLQIQLFEDQEATFINMGLDREHDDGEESHGNGVEDNDTDTHTGTDTAGVAGNDPQDNNEGRDDDGSQEANEHRQPNVTDPDPVAALQAVTAELIEDMHNSTQVYGPPGGWLEEEEL